PAHRKHSCANSRNSLGDAAMARSAGGTGGSATGLSATGACVRAAAGDKGQDITVKTVPIAVSGCRPWSDREERARFLILLLRPVFFRSASVMARWSETGAAEARWSISSTKLASGRGFGFLDHAPELKSLGIDCFLDRSAREVVRR